MCRRWYREARSRKLKIRPRTWRPSASPTSARPRFSGTRATGKPIHNAIVWQDTRTDRLVRDLWRRRSGRTAFRDALRPAAGHLLLRAKDQRWLLDNVEGARQGRKAGESSVRHHGQLADLESHRPPRHRRDQRQPHHADEPAKTLDWDDELLARRSACPAPCCPRSDRLVEVYGTDRHAASRGRSGRRGSATSRRPCSARPVSRSARANAPYGTGMFPAWPIPASKIVQSKNGLADHGGLPDRRGSRWSMRWRGRSRWRARLVQWLRDNLGLITRRRPTSRRSPARWTTTAAAISYRPFRACSLRTGARTLAA